MLCLGRQAEFRLSIARPSATSRRYVSVGKPERRDLPPDSWEGQTASHRAKSPRHAMHYPFLETLPARGLTRRLVPERRLARARPLARVRRSDCAGAKLLSTRRARVSPDHSFRGGGHDACPLL